MGPGMGRPEAWCGAGSLVSGQAVSKSLQSPASPEPLPPSASDPQGSLPCLGEAEDSHNYGAFAHRHQRPEVAGLLQGGLGPGAQLHPEEGTLQNPHE